LNREQRKEEAAYSRGVVSPIPIQPPPANHFAPVASRPAAPEPSPKKSAVAGEPRMGGKVDHFPLRPDTTQSGFSAIFGGGGSDRGGTPYSQPTQGGVKHDPFVTVLDAWGGDPSVRPGSSPKILSDRRGKVVLEQKKGPKKSSMFQRALTPQGTSMPKPGSSSIKGTDAMLGSTLVLTSNSNALTVILRIRCHGCVAESKGQRERGHGEGFEAEKGLRFKDPNPNPNPNPNP